MIDLFQHLDGLFASLFHLVLTVGKLGLLVFIALRLYPHIRKHFVIGHKPSGNVPKRPASTMRSRPPNMPTTRSNISKRPWT